MYSLRCGVLKYSGTFSSGGCGVVDVENIVVHLVVVDVEW